MSDKAINRLFMAYLHNYYCNYHWGPVPALILEFGFFWPILNMCLAYFGPEDLATLAQFPDLELFCHFTRRPSLSASSRPVLLGADHECGLPNNTANRVMHCNTIFARRRIFTRVAMYTVNSRPAEFHKITIPFPAQTMRV